MKKLITLFFTLVTILFFSHNSLAQDKPATHISSVTQKGETIRFSLTSSKPFIFGNNRYILYIGNKEFTRNEQSKDNGTGSMTFFIPVADFDRLQDGIAIYLSYGESAIEEQDMDELSKNSSHCWSLGKFSKTLLTK